MKIKNRNIKVIAINKGNEAGFNIFIDFSGQKELLMSHRHNGLLYKYLKDGICLTDLKFMKPSKYICLCGFSRRNSKVAFTRIDSMIRHINNVVNNYIIEKEII